LEEGVEGLVPFSGSAKTVFQSLVDGLRASFGYAGARSIHELWSVARFGSISPQGLAELGAHSVRLDW
jgi:IMP dehydrogenase